MVDPVRRPPRVEEGGSLGGSEISDTDPEITDLRVRHQKQRETLSLSRSPLETLKLFSFALAEQVQKAAYYMTRSILLLSLVVVMVLTFAVLAAVDTSEKMIIHTVVAYTRFCLWWLCLGIASSVGLGSGLHTFVLYLGPHIARFTLKATACGRLDLKSAPYDTAQWASDASWSTKECASFGPPLYPHFPSEHGGYFIVPLLHLMAAVQLESFLWGLGTAIGELPPYFVSRAARLSGDKVKELEELEMEVDGPPSNSIFQRLKLWTFSHSRAFGFFTILAFASVPNPLFDLAGITCGHFLVPFWKFFVATAIGKSIVKTSLQTVMVVTVFSAHSVEILETALERFLVRIPALLDQVPKIMEALDEARSRLSGGSHKSSASGFSLATIWSCFVLLMLLAFLASVVSSTARGYLIDRQREEMRELQKKVRKGKGRADGPSG